MRRVSYKKYLVFSSLLFFLLILPPLFVEKVRGKTVGVCAPFWKAVVKVKTVMGGEKRRLLVENERYVTENHLLRLEVEKLRALVANRVLLEEWKGKVVPGRVIFRDPSSFGSSLWINVGQESNRKFGKVIIEKNSPVVWGKAVVGVIDYVGKTASRVRLLTDSALHPSVCVLGEKNSLSEKEKGWYLARGLVHGSGAPLWRVKGWQLKGTGFHCEGEKTKEIVLGDVLVTTGMDGVFPKGLHVGTVTRVFPLREGAYTYEIEARPSAGYMHELHTVFVIAKVEECEESDEKECHSK